MQPLEVDTGNRLTASDGAAGVFLCTGGPGSNFGPTYKEQRERIPQFIRRESILTYN